jgi:SAM-dependent methyltransferase
MTHLLWTARVDDLAQFCAYNAHIEPAILARSELERALCPPGATRHLICGYCGVCQRDTDFLIDFQYAFTLPDGTQFPNLRERLECVHCRLNTRMRGALHFMRDHARMRTDSVIYACEQITPLFRAVADRYKGAIGSEYLHDGTPRGGTNTSGIRHEDATQLTFKTASFDCILSFDVLEHIPDYNPALGEALRCLRPGGRLLLTVPFNLGATDHLERATLINGNVQHLLPPEYHGDPLNESGALCFRHYGWGLLDELRAIGFSEAAMYFYWSRELGYLGGNPFIIMAVKS